jgi:hypothetical protein
MLRLARWPCRVAGFVLRRNRESEKESPGIRAWSVSGPDPARGPRLFHLEVGPGRVGRVGPWDSELLVRPSGIDQLWFGHSAAAARSSDRLLRAQDWDAFHPPPRRAAGGDPCGGHTAGRRTAARNAEKPPGEEQGRQTGRFSGPAADTAARRRKPAAAAAAAAAASGRCGGSCLGGTSRFCWV